jgi:hypothetical protein
MDEAFGHLLDMLPLLTAFVLVLLVVGSPKGDGDARWKRSSNDPRQQTRTFADRVLRGIMPPKQ